MSAGFWLTLVICIEVGGAVIWWQYLLRKELVQIGMWIIVVTSDAEMMHYGANGDSEFPFTDEKKMKAELQHLSSCAPIDTDRFYIQRLFANGQQKTEEWSLAS